METPDLPTPIPEQGDTLVEVLLALVILGIASVALLAGFATSIGASAEHRNLASLDSSTRLAANTAIADIQQQAPATEGSADDPVHLQHPVQPELQQHDRYSRSPTPYLLDAIGWAARHLQLLPESSAIRPDVTSTSSRSYSTP